MKFTRLGQGEATVFDGLRYAGAHLFNGIVILLSLGRFTSDSVWKCSLKLALRFRARQLKEAE
jgi:hypothetical protein